ncbi:CsbD family protein [Curvibacter sp. HBC28]|uniref:CsbD family protein n=1 Tax=Curvibacter microcysteis TaxID=3026419 RepID=A0ABT5MLJ3_9BURK|nr:CsbD family protein [Curvibacter sp. HBC28]MDD0816734.1 CsbD family protein [Curvibacter sp. HBC28]
MINKDQVAGATQNAIGKTQESTGKILHDKALQAKGLKNQAAGTLQAKKGDAVEALDAARKAVKDAAGHP